MTKKTVTLESILADIETLRASKGITNEAANVASFALGLTGDDAILANRVLVQGSDPLSLELVHEGEVSTPIRSAHYQGPGALTGDDKQHWLMLASVSLDESAQKEMPTAGKISQFIEAIIWLKRATPEEKAEAAAAEEEAIKKLPFQVEDVQGVNIRVYQSDRGFAAAYWSGEEFAAVRSSDGLLFVGSREKPLNELGITPHKELSPQFGIIFPPKED